MVYNLLSYIYLHTTYVFNPGTVELNTVGNSTLKWVTTYTHTRYFLLSFYSKRALIEQQSNQIDAFYALQGIKKS